MDTPVLFNLAGISFHSRGLGPQELRRENGYTWAEVPRIGRNPALQFVGREAESISMQGVIYPGIDGAKAELVERLRFLGIRGQPGSLTDALGNNYGSFVVTRVTEIGRILTVDGTARSISFVLDLRRHDR